MATDLHVYENEHGDPVVVMVTTGTHDVSRLVSLMERGRCEDLGRARELLAACWRHKSGRAALHVLRDHGGPDLLERTPSEQARCKRLHLATSDPGAIVQRERERHSGQWVYESLSHWQMRAVLAVTAPWMAEQDRAA
jgi:hypothetical protein